LLQLHNIILEMIAKGRTLADTAERLCIEVERLVPGVICSVVTVGDDCHLHPLAGPSLPTSFSAAIDGAPSGPCAGSCGTAVYLRTDVAAVNIKTDPRWATYKDLALPLGLRACWSSPVLDERGVALGTFDFYYHQPRGPTALEREIVQHCVHLLVIAIERHQRVAEHERRAFTDALTGLQNRAAFNTALATLECDVPGSWALFVVDLDNLKVVNDTFGHHAGDCLLKVAAERIVSAILPARTFRIGGDEFAIILQHPDTLHDLDSAAERILAALSTPAGCGGHIVVPRATIGGAVLNAGDRVAERVRQNADFALYHAKETGRGGFVRYWPGLGTNITHRLQAIRDVDAALREDRIDAYYQPIVRLDTREIVGLEALCRMQVGDGVVAAGAFHEATMDIHIATALTERMVTLVAADVRAWLDMGIPFQHVGINVSSADMHGGTLHRVLTKAFERENVPLRHIILEVTEGVYMGDGNRAVQQSLEPLREKGLRVALDDFGTGFASLTHLLTVPVDIIKIDKSFVGRLAPGDASMAIVTGLIGIARDLDMRVVAEGVETEEQAAYLEAAGCQLGQGYLFSKAVDREAATRLLLKRSQPLRGALAVNASATT
jgi:diguanylate cyclase (GGDEF)-like protein